MKIVGVIPVRMAASRFPGKPMFKILGKPMVEHVYRRSAMYPKWSHLCVATCDEEIMAFGRAHGWSTIMTSNTHQRALDRVAEAAAKCGQALAPDDVVICVQGDEPMLQPDMMDAAMQPLIDDASVLSTVLAMEIVDEAIYRHPDTVKIVHDLAGNVVFQSRAPVPFARTGMPAKPYVPRRIYGIFAFRWHFLQAFTAMAMSPLEIAESADTNRIIDHGFRQKIAPYPFRPSFSVDSPADAANVERHMKDDPLWGQY
jgi:3-deoxy-manno-octulosonate cytidylyltransferase (CMP-KDO synthetase)